MAGEKPVIQLKAFDMNFTTTLSRTKAGQAEVMLEAKSWSDMWRYYLSSPSTQGPGIRCAR